jgi:hypothetical protein
MHPGVGDVLLTNDAESHVMAQDKASRGRPGDAAITELVRWLLSRGYTITTDEYWPEAFGNRLISLDRSAVRVELNKDRSEWLVSLGSADTPEEGSFDPALWQLVLASHGSASSALALPAGISSLQAVLPEVEHHLNRGWAGWELLRQARSQQLTEALRHVQKADATAAGGEAAARVARYQRSKKRRKADGSGPTA